MGAATRDFRSMIALVLRGAVEGSQMTVVATAERTTIDWCTPEGTVATFTARKRPVFAAAVAPSRQLGLPGVTEAPVPVAPAPPSNALVELVAIAGWEPMPPVEVLEASTAVLWTGVTDKGPWRTVVSASVADTLQAFAPGCFERRAPTAPSHLLQVGSLVAWAGAERAVLGLVASDGEDSCGAVLDVDGDPMVAWLDSAKVEGDRVRLFPSARHRGVPGDDGWWTAQHHQAPAPLAPVAEDDDAPALYRLWLPARGFGELTDVGREVYEHPDVDTELTWEVRGEHVTAADVTESVAGIVCELAREDSFAFHVGPEAPVAVAPKKAKALKAPKPKPAPGSKGHPHRGVAIPEADALAQQGALVAVALQPDGHWKLWASNPEKPGGALMTSPEWRKRWGGARRADLRVRLYNRARRCSHDSLDGDHEEAGR